MRELLTDEPFTKADIITLQDPAHPERFDLSTFHYVRNQLSLDTDASEPTQYLRTVNPETKATLESLAKEYKEPQVRCFHSNYILHPPLLTEVRG